LKACILTLCVWALACKPLPSSTQCITDTALQQGVNDPIIEYNSTKEYVLCIQSESIQPHGLVTFLVLETKGCRIIEKGIFRPGHIKWISANEIEVLDLPGALDGDKDLTTFKKTISIKNKFK
jgi:hypothetical protein